MNGIILTDYGFTPPSISSNGPEKARTTLSSWNIQQQKLNTDQAFESITTISTTASLPTFSQTPMTLTLPNPKPHTSPLSSDSPSNALHILAVDDNALNLQLLHRYLLKRSRDTIVTARNGLEAVAAIESHGRGFDVIFMDISMPEMDGFEATRLIRAYENLRFQASEAVEGVGSGVGENGVGYGGIKRGDRSRAYIVALTGLASRRDRDLAQECGFDDFLTKPVGFKRIGEVLGGLSGKG
jgi:CheY-like chemotaxis protein